MGNKYIIETGKFMYSIGKLAKMSHISIRTLHYYDEIGLLLPTHKNDAGHRFYSDKDISKLHYILMLKDLGFPLETILQFLSDREFDIQSVLSMRKKMILAEKESLREMEKSIDTLLTIVETETNTDWETLFKTFSTFPADKSLVKVLWEKYFTEEEQQILNRFSSPEEDREGEKTWLSLAQEVRQNLHKGPDSTEARSLAKRWMALVDEMYQGNAELAQKVWDMNKEREPHMRFFMFDQEIITFIDQAIRHYFDDQEANQ